MTPDTSAPWFVVDTAPDIEPAAHKTTATDNAATTASAAEAPAGQRVRHRGVGLVRVCGEIDLGTRGAFEAGLEQVLAGDPRRMVLDFSAMAFCSAGGLAAIMRTVAQGAERGTDVAVVGLSPLLQRLCSQLWPGPQPIPYITVDDAVRAATPVTSLSAVSPTEAA